MKRMFNSLITTLKLFALLLTVIDFTLTSAQAHDTWADGEPVPAWVKQQCCGISDAHYLRPDQVHVVPGGYQVDKYAKVIPENQMMPSPDGSYWVFYRDYPDRTQSGVFCFFGPAVGS